MIKIYRVTNGCRAGGTFKHSDFAGLLDFQDDKIIPAVTPVGYATAKHLITVIRQSDELEYISSWQPVN